MHKLLKESKVELIRKLAEMYPKHYCKANIAIDIYNRIRNLSGREFLITADDQFPITVSTTIF